MKRKMLISSLEDGEFFLECEDSLETVEFTPLEERLRVDSPELMEGMSRLKAAMGADDFQKYINSLLKMTKHEDMMLLITGSALNKSIIELRFLKLLAESFEIKKIRIFSQAG